MRSEIVSILAIAGGALAQMPAGYPDTYGSWGSSSAAPEPSSVAPVYSSEPVYSSVPSYPSESGSSWEPVYSSVYSSVPSYPSESGSIPPYPVSSSAWGYSVYPTGSFAVYPTGGYPTGGYSAKPTGTAGGYPSYSAPSASGSPVSISSASAPAYTGGSSTPSSVPSTGGAGINQVGLAGVLAAVVAALAL